MTEEGGAYEVLCGNGQTHTRHVGTAESAREKALDLDGLARCGLHSVATDSGTSTEV